MKRFSINNLDYEKRKRLKLIAIIALIIVLNALLIWVFASNSGDKSIEAALTEPDTRVHETNVPEGYTAIYNVDGLKAMSSNLSGKYILMSDIDLTGTIWDVIGTSSSSSFIGTLDGNNYTISNLNIESNNQYVGMFGYTKGAAIKNLIVENITVKSTYSDSSNGYVGGLVGYTTGTSSVKTTIENVGVTGTSKIENSTEGSNIISMGGLVGYAYNYTDITNSYSNAEVVGSTKSGTLHVGGLVGYNVGYSSSNKNTLTNVYSTGNVTGTSISGMICEGGLVGGIGPYTTIENAFTTSNTTATKTTGTTYVGGLVGYSAGAYIKNINNTYAVGKIDAEIAGRKSIGGLIGYNYRYTTVTNSYWSPETIGVDTSATTGEQAKLLQEMLYMNTYTDWDFDTVWDIDEGNTLPYLQGMPKPASVNENNYTYLKYEGEGTASNPYIIRTKEQLQGINNNLNQAHYKLGNDIDVTGIENFEPIGNATYPFTGTLDGAGFKISNVNIESAEPYIGMFGYTSGAIIKDLIIENIIVKSNFVNDSSSIYYAYVGGLAGYTKGGKLENIKLIGTSKVELSTASHVYIGGIAGSISDNANVVNTSSNTEVLAIVGGTTKNIGGLIGSVNGVTISSSYATGSITVIGGSSAYAGGLIGEVNGTGTIIDKCYSTGNLDVNISGNQYIGGLIGKSFGTITNVYSTSNVNLNKKSTLDYIGGLIGYNDASLTNAYAVGRVDIQNLSTSGCLGGLLGTSVNNRSVNNCYWSPETTKQYETAKGIGKLFSNMLYSDSYDNWDFENVWSIQEGQTLPYIQGIDTPTSIAKTNYNYIPYEGKGTISNPNIIRTEEQLQEIRSDLSGTHYELANDIILTKNFEPIGNATYPFTGTLDGLGHTITGLNIDLGLQSVGMFGYVSGATIKNLILKDVNVKSTYSNSSYVAYVGGLIGYAINNTLIEGIEILGESSVENVAGLSIIRIGGLIGTLDKSTLSKVGTTAKIKANSNTTAIYAGGVAGYLNGSSNTNLARITNAYSTGEILATSTSGKIYAGGLTGYTSLYTNINNVYAVGKIERSTDVLNNNIGGLVGDSTTSNVTVVSSYYSPETTGQNVGVIGKSERFVNMLKASTYSGWFDTESSVWTIEEGNTLPYFKDMEKPVSVNKENYTYLADTVDGNGTSTNPYIIRTEAELQNLLVLQAGTNTVYFELGNDIEITKNFTPIGDTVCPFSSVLDGKGYTIKNMQIEAPNQYIGMLGYTNGAIIKNLTLENETVKSTYSSTNTEDTTALGKGACIGGLIGYSNATTVENVKTIGQNKIESNIEKDNTVYVGGLIGFAYGTSKDPTTIKKSTTSGQVLGESTKGMVFAGGLIGCTANGYGYVTIENTYSTADVLGTSTTGTEHIGGLLGIQNYPTSITNSYATGEILANSTSAQANVGGLVGKINGGTITNTYAVGKVSANTTGTKSLGGLVGNRSSGTINSSYFSPETTLQMPNGLGKEKLLCSMLKQNCYEGWDFDTVWTIKEGETLPYLQGLTEPEEIKKGNYDYINYEGDGTEENPYLIKTEQQLKGIKYILDGVHYKLANDITLTENFEPLGNETYPFKSTFDGDNHTISNLNIESDEQYVGMFGYVNSGTIKNLTLENVEINTTNSLNVGSLAGYVTGINTIDNVSISGTSNIEYQYTNTGTSLKCIGGLVGYIYNGSTSNLTTVINSNSTANISATNSVGNIEVGGLIGGIINKVTIENSYAIGKVLVTSTSGKVDAGGLVGYCNNKDYGTIKTSYATGNVSAKGSNVYIGGLIGTGGTITNAFAIGNVSASASEYLYIGGLIGKANSSTISNTYAVGKVTALSSTNRYVGGLTGLTGTVTDSYWSPKTTKQETSAAGTAKTIQELLHQTTYENWDFDAVWTIDEGTSLAYLKDLPKPDEINGEDLDFETRVRAYVKDEIGNVLANAEFVVKNEAGEVLRTGLTNEKGIYNILDLEPGVYTLEQTNAPISYIKDTTIKTFKLTEEGTTVDPTTNEEITLDIVNERYKLHLRNLEKGTDKPIKGAVIGLFDDAGNLVTGVDGKVIRGTTDEFGDIVLMKMPSGTYKYKQTVAKTGYIIDPTEYTVTIAEDGTVTFGEDNSGVIYNEKIKIDVTANKVWNDNNNIKGKRPDSVKVNLYKWYRQWSSVLDKYYYTNKELVDSIVLTEADNWSHTFNVDKYNDNSVQIYYTVEEEAVNEGDFKFYTGAVREYTITNTYSVPSNIPYKVEHYKQNDTLDGYVLAETENLTGTFEKTVTAVAKDYDGYILNTNVSGTIQKGVIVEDGSLVLKLYYDKLKTATFNVNISNLDAENSEPIANTKYDIWVRYSDGTKATYPEQTTNEQGSILIPTVLGKTITRVYFKQTKMENGHKIDLNQKYVEIKVDGLTAELSLTGSKSEDIIANIEDNTLYITQTNEQMTYSNKIRINALDNVDKDIKIGDVSFEIVMPDGAIKNIATNEDGIAEIDNLTAPGTGTYLYEIRQLNKVNGYNEKTDTIYANITFNNDGIITNVSIIRGDAKASVIKEAKDKEEITIANINITEIRESNEVFSDYTLKIIESDLDTNNLVSGVTYKVIQVSKINGMSTTSSSTKTTNEAGEAIFNVADASEITFTIKRTGAPSEYKLIKDEIQVKVRNNNGEYELIEEVPGVTIDTDTNEIIVNRSIYNLDSKHNIARQKINNTIYITKIDEYYRPLQNVDMQLRAYKCKNGGEIDKNSPLASWDLTTDSKGLAKINSAQLIESLGSEFPKQLMEEEGKLEFWITEISVPVGYERPETDIGFEVQYEFSDKGKLEIITMNVLDGASYYHIADQSYDQYEEEKYIQADIKLKVINPHSKVIQGPDGEEEEVKFNKLKIEKVDSEDNTLKLANATFKVTLTYPETTLDTGETKIFKTTTEVKTGRYGLGSISNLSFPEGTTKVEIQELSTPSEYILDSTKLTLNVTNTAGVITVDGGNSSINENGEILVQIENTKKEIAKPYNIIVQKRDSNNKAIIYSITEFDIKVTSGNNTKTYNRRTNNGKVSLNNLNGKGIISIEIIEADPPIGYKINDSVKTININKEKLSTQIELIEDYENVKIINNTIYVDIYDEPDEQVPVLQIRKVDSKNTYIGLENAKFTVTLPDENNTSRRVSTTQNGYANIILANGISGRYIIEETEAPNGYYTTKKIALDIVFDEAKNVISCDVVSGLGEEYADSVLGKSVNSKKINITIADEKIEIPEIKTYGIHIDKVSTTNNYIKLNNVYFDINIQEEKGINYAVTKKTEDYRGIYITELTGSGKIKLSLQEVSAPSGYTQTSGIQELVFTRDEQTQELVLDTNSLVNIDASDITIDNTNHMVHIRVKNIPNNEEVVEPDPIPPVPTVTPTPIDPTPTPTPIDPTPTTTPTPTPVPPTDDPTWPELKDPIPTPIDPTPIVPTPIIPSPIKPVPEQTQNFAVAIEKSNTYNRKIKVAGAQYVVYVLNEETNEQINKIKTTNTNGKIYIPELTEYGDFTITIVEINAPAGYAIDEHRHTIKIHRDEQSKLITIRETNLGENAEVKIDNINKIVNVAFNEAPSSIGLAVFKRDSEDENLGIENIEFKILDTETGAEYKLTTGDEGMDFTTLPVKSDGVHTFKITEVTKPEGYIKNTPFVLSVRYLDGLIQSAEITSGPVNLAHVEKQTTEYIELSILNQKETTNEKFNYDIELIKGDAYYPSIIFKDALIKINVNNEVGVKGLTKTALTNEEGKISINGVYGYGQVDINITELIPPPGRRFDKKVKAVRLIIDSETGKIKLDKQTSNVDVFIDNENRKITIRVRNYPDGTFIVGANKVDAEDKDLILTGAEYKIQEEGSDKTYYAKEYTKGLLTFSEIPMPNTATSKTFTYIITETKAPVGYEINTTPTKLKIEVTNNNGIITITDAQIEGENGEVISYTDEFVHLRLMDHKLQDSDKYTITLTKVDATLQEEVLKDALIGIKVKAESGEEYYKKVRTDEFGKINLSEVIGTGRIEVTITELEAPTNYIKSETPKTVVFTRNPETKEITVDASTDEEISIEEKDGNIEIVLKNTLDLNKAQYVKVRKVQKDTEIGLSGAVIILENENGDELQRRTTDKDGYVTFIAEIGKTYKYKEVTPPLGYTLNETEYSFNVLEDGTIEDVLGNRVIENAKVTMKESFTITKKRAETEIVLSGAVIGIFDTEGNEIIRETTGEDGTVTISGLEVGSYYYKEITPPIGYILNETEYHFTVENDGTLTFAENANKVIQNSRVTMKESLTITKMKTGTEIKLSGAVIGIFNAEGNEIVRKTTNEEGVVTFEGLEPGEYYYKEISAPIGYVINETEYHFTVTNEGEVELAEGSNKIIYNDIETITITVEKVWVDTEEQNAKRPTNIVIKVKNGDTVVASKTISNTTENITFENLPKYDTDLNEINYTVEEAEENVGDLKYYVANVVKNADGTYTITNTFTVPEETITIIVHKVWVDTEAQRAKRPANIVIQIKNGDTVIASKTVSNTTENITFENLPKYDANGNEINYTVEEAEENVGDLKYYAATISGDKTNGYTITNTFTLPEDKLSITVQKVWVDTEAQKAKRPANIVIQIKNGDTVIASKTVSNTTENITFENLPKYDVNGNEINYTVAEIEENVGDLKYYVADIVKNADGTYTITNTFTVPDETITMVVQKVWVDTEEQKAKRPANIVIQVKNGDTVVASQTVPNATETITFENLPKYDVNGNEINYTVEESEENDGELKYYVASIVKNADGTYTITNTFKVPDELLKVTIKKIDEITKAGLPGAVIELISEDGTILEGTTRSDGCVTFGGLEVGEIYKYKEKTPPTGYSLNINEYSFRINELGEIEDITGNRIIEDELEMWNSRIDIAVRKVWVDTEGQKVKRPANIVIQVKNGDTVVASKTVSNTTENITFKDLPKYDENRIEIKYIVDEVEENDEDLKYYVANVVKNADGTYTVTNTFTVPTELLKVTIRKIDAVTKQGLKGATITVQDENGNKASAATDDNGYVTFTGLVVGKTYTYKETVPPIGYTLNTNEYSFRVNEIGEIEDVAGNRVIENNRVTMLEGLTITKVKTGTTIKLPGAVIGVFKDDSTKIEEKTTGEDGTVTFTGLEIGNYYYQEITPPSGYILDDTQYHFTVTNEGKIELAEGSTKIIYNARATMIEELTITKMQVGTTIKLPGAIIGIFNNEGKEIERKTTNADGTVTFRGLESGQYYYKEIQAPEGYTLNNTEYHFEVTDKGIIANEENQERIIYNDVIPEEIRVNVPIYKMDALTKVVLSGVKIGLYDSTGNAIEEKTTTEDGKVIFANLVAGQTYKYKEIAAPLGYVLNDTMYSFKLAEDGTIEYLGDTIEIDGVKYAVIYNEPLKVDVPIYKMDALTKVVLSGAKIGLYDNEGNAITEGITGEDGKVVFTGLLVEKTYKYKEIEAPEGYILNNAIYSFKVAKDGTIEYLGETIEIDGVKYAVIYNEPLKVDVPIYKMDALTKVVLSGAKIGLYDNEGNAITEGITGEDGKVVFTGLLVGKTYKYKEIEAPDGYTLNNTIYSFKVAKDGTIEYLGETIEINGIKYAVIYNEELKLDVPIYKADITTKELLSGAKIGLYDESGNVIEEKVTEEGKVVFTGLIPGKTYKYKEIEAPKGYLLNDITYSFRVAKNGTIEYLGETIEIGGIKYIAIYNEPLRIDVPIYKADIITKELLSGAKIGLYDNEGNSITEGITEEDGKIIFSKLMVGKTYKYKEIVSPKGYSLNSEMYSFEVAEDGTIIFHGETIEIDGVKYAVIYDEVLKVDVPIYKMDILTKAFISGAKIGLYDDEGNAITEGITGEDGKVVFTKLIIGKRYKYKELVPPSGYILNDTMYSFEIAKDGTIMFYGDTVEIGGIKYIVIYNEPLRIDVPIYKKDILTEELLSGAVIGLYDTSGKSIEINGKAVRVTTDETGKAVFKGLKPGTVYQYKEEVAPDGYEINLTMYAFRIKEDGTIVYDSAKGIIYDTMIVAIPEIPTPPNTDTKLPQTGINTIVTGILMMLTGMSVCGTIYYKRKIM